ncbi:hydrolase [Sulfurospirillum arcachonense]|uniref:hydrolase n=1 Tax=Sulfurospirillum arcachonense TaxID=57666 RepID=UPI00046A86D1|nr:hydrolase [Sulfurospirillum arcachonense]
MRIDLQQTQALVVDIQEKIFPHISNNELLLKNTLKLIKGLKILQVPFILNEQYPQGIGYTIEPIKELLKNEIAYEKFTFSCCKTDTTMNVIKQNKKKFVIVFGIEAHVCVLQSVLDLLEHGFIPVLVTDCINSRNSNDKTVAIQRMIQAGAIPTTYESILFELCLSSKNEIFKELSAVVK